MKNITTYWRTKLNPNKPMTQLFFGSCAPIVIHQATKKEIKHLEIPYFYNETQKFDEYLGRAHRCSRNISSFLFDLNILRAAYQRLKGNLVCIFF